MFPNLPNTNKYSENQLTDFSNDKLIKDPKILFIPEKYYSLNKDLPKQALNMDSFIIHNYPLNYPYIDNHYSFLPNYPHYSIFGDWNNTWIKK